MKKTLILSILTAGILTASSFASVGPIPEISKNTSINDEFVEVIERSKSGIILLENAGNKIIENLPISEQKKNQASDIVKDMKDIGINTGDLAREIKEGDVNGIIGESVEIAFGCLSLLGKCMAACKKGDLPAPEFEVPASPVKVATRADVIIM